MDVSTDSDQANTRQGCQGHWLGYRLEKVPTDCAFSLDGDPKKKQRDTLEKLGTKLISEVHSKNQAEQQQVSRNVGSKLFLQIPYKHKFKADLTALNRTATKLPHKAFDRAIRNLVMNEARTDTR